MVDIEPAVKARLLAWRDTTHETSCAEIDSLMSFSNNKPLRSILFSLKIRHRCSKSGESALAIAQELWDRNYDTLMHISEGENLRVEGSRAEEMSYNMEGGSDDGIHDMLDGDDDAPLQHMKVPEVDQELADEVSAMAPEDKVASQAAEEPQPDGPEGGSAADAGGEVDESGEGREVQGPEGLEKPEGAEAEESLGKEEINEREEEPASVVNEEA